MNRVFLLNLLRINTIPEGRMGEKGMLNTRACSGSIKPGLRPAVFKLKKS